jgi:hypothetical protein
MPLRPWQYRQMDKKTGGFGKEISTDLAKLKMKSYVEQLHRQMFFLSHVQVIELWQWDAGASEAHLLGRVSSEQRQFLPRHIGGAKSVAFKRVPDSIKASGQAESFQSLVEHTKSLSLEARNMLMLGSREVSLITIEVQRKEEGEDRKDDGGDPRTEKTVWLSLQQYDINRELEDLVAHPKVEKLPVVGVALRLSKRDAPVPGGLYCFLPIGDMKTHLPVHLNADFKLTPDRRKLVPRTLSSHVPARVTRTLTCTAMRPIMARFKLEISRATQIPIRPRAS